MGWEFTSIKLVRWGYKPTSIIGGHDLESICSKPNPSWALPIGLNIIRTVPIRGLSSKSGKFRQSGNYFWIKNIKGFGFRFFSSPGTNSNPLWSSRVWIQRYSHVLLPSDHLSCQPLHVFTLAFFSSSVPFLKRPGKRTGSSPFQAPSDGCHSAPVETTGLP